MMKNYLKLHRLAFRSRVAAAANLAAGDQLRRHQAELRQLQVGHNEMVKTIYIGGSKERDAKVAEIEVAIERAIAVRDILIEERQRAEEVFGSASAAYRSVRTYLEDNRQLIPEGIPDGI